ncbi:zinc-dependent peptidase [Pseudorhodoferax sp.]|uniref:M90 family metallopeptidase n=1 Tax=Pseudorhodoferax sp. TaxID=1993553 RepID=UPI002DD66AA3|nr:M90 family metallopeptidase [Pseudorhodoferax sp.]
MPTLSQFLFGATVLGALLAALGIALSPAWQSWRRRRLARQPFPAAWRRVLARHVPQVRRLPVDLQLRLKQLMQVFIAQKPFIGCDGLVVTEAMRVVVAAQACLLLLNRPQWHYANLRQVLLYPGAFLVDRVRTEAGGVLRDERQVLAGESWSQGQVVLSWDDVLAGAADPTDGRNVVVHEFAHQLDQADGQSNGAPPLPQGMDARRWARVLQAEFDHLQRQLAAGEENLLGAYAATNSAEFFAVASEVFFEQGPRLAATRPALYAELAAFYGLEPTSW